MPRNPASAVVVVVTAIAVALPPPCFAQPRPAPVSQEAATEFNVEQLAELMAPFAVYLTSC